MPLYCSRTAGFRGGEINRVGRSMQSESPGGDSTVPQLAGEHLCCGLLHAPCRWVARNAHLPTSLLGFAVIRSPFIMAAPPSPDKKKKGGKVGSHRDKLP